MRINNNISSMVTQGSLFKVNRETAKSLEKLSTGLRINRSADDAAGLGVSENLRTQVIGIGQANRNTQDAIALLNIAEGALNEMSDILQRMRELVVEAKNDTYTQTERNYMGEEFMQLANEIDRIAYTTNYNGMDLFANKSHKADILDGSPKVLQDAADIGAGAVFGANDDGAATHFNIMVGQNFKSLDSGAFSTTTNAFGATAANVITIQLGQMDIQGVFGKSTESGTSNTALSLMTAAGTNVFACDTGWKQAAFSSDIQNQLTTLLEIIDGDSLTSTSTGALAFNGTNYSGIDRVNRMRSYIGATVNRLEHNVNNLIEMEASQQAAESQIRDADFASETARFTRNQLLTQSATSMLAQANMRPQSILQLLG